jgi:hypothetical protein
VGKLLGKRNTEKERVNSIKMDLRGFDIGDVVPSVSTAAKLCET